MESRGVSSGERLKEKTMAEYDEDRLREWSSERLLNQPDLQARRAGAAVVLEDAPARLADLLRDPGWQVIETAVQVARDIGPLTLLEPLEASATLLLVQA